MRPYLECFCRDSLCIIHEFSEFCEQCVRFGRCYDLAFSVGAIEKLARQEYEILTQISLTHKEIRETEAKVARFRK
jgi:hypothetical protein